MLLCVAGLDGEALDDSLQKIGALTLRIQLEGRNGTHFDNIRSYPYLSVGAPIRAKSAPFRVLWKKKRAEMQKLWEEELWETGEVPKEFNDTVASAFLKQHGWAQCIWIFFPIDCFPGSSRYIVNGLWDNTPGKWGTLDINMFVNDNNALETISLLLQETKRSCDEDGIKNM